MRKHARSRWKWPKNRNLITIATTLAISFFAYSALAAEKPVGDGVTDDTAAIQALLDSRDRLVYLPPPEKCYLISDTLKIHSNQTLRLDPGSTIRLADGAKRHLISNADFDAGNENIAVIGGIWDGNNATQTFKYHEPDYKRVWEPFDPNEYIGVLMQFKNIRNLTVRDLTLKDPETYGVLLGLVTGFDVENILFDYNLLKLNMDGIHLCGGCRQGRIVNLRGNTNDDMVALNADDWGLAELSRGEISDVKIDGLWCDNGYTAVRILSAGHPVRRVHISNVFGSWRFYVVSFTHHNVHPGEPSLIEDVQIDSVFTAKVLEGAAELPPEQFDERQRKNQPLFRIESGMKVKNLTIKDFTRREKMTDAAATLHVERGAAVESLTLRDVTMANRSNGPLTFIRCDGLIDGLTMDSVRLEQGENAPIEKIVGSGICQEAGEDEKSDEKTPLLQTPENAVSITPADFPPINNPAMKWSQDGVFAKDPSVVRFDGKYWMYYSYFLKADGEKNRLTIGVAQSDDLTDWRFVKNILPMQECDQKGLGAPCAKVIDGKVWLFYQTYGNGPLDAICCASSENGVDFTPHPENPIFRPTGDWNNGRAIDADLIEFKGKVFLYAATRDPSGKRQMLTAAFADPKGGFGPKTWTQAADRPILAPELPWETRCIEAPSVVEKDGRLLMFYAGGFNNDPQHIGLAASGDGIHWTRVWNAPFITNGPEGAWNASESGHPGVFVDDDGATWLFYQGNATRGKDWFLSRVPLDWRVDGGLTVPFVKQ